MRSSVLLILWTLFIPGLLGQSAIQEEARAEDLLQEAILHMFDGRWEEGLRTIKRAQQHAGEGPILQRSYFYEARALKQLRRREEAAQKYADFLAGVNPTSPLREEAHYSLIELSVQLANRSNPRYLPYALDSLQSPNPDLRLMSALQLSYVENPEIQKRAVPVLKRFLETTKDPEIEHQATVALLRIDPKHLEKSETGAESRPAGNLHVLITGQGDDIKLSLPVSWARILVSALPARAREHLIERGINPDNILAELKRAEQIIEIRSKDGHLKIWID